MHRLPGRSGTGRAYTQGIDARDTPDTWLLYCGGVVNTDLRESGGYRTRSRMGRCRNPRNAKQGQLEAYGAREVPARESRVEAVSPSCRAPVACVPRRLRSRGRSQRLPVWELCTCPIGTDISLISPHTGDILVRSSQSWCRPPVGAWRHGDTPVSPRASPRSSRWRPKLLR